MRIPSGTTDQYIYFVAVDATDYATRETGLSAFTVYRSRNGAAAAAMTTPTINETDATNMPGVYELLLDEDMTIGAGNDSEEMCFHITATGMAPVTRTIELYRPKLTEGRTLSVEADGDLTKVNTLNGHTAQTGDSFARLGAPAGASVSADIAGVDTAVGALNNISAADVNAQCDQALIDYDGPTATEMNASFAALNDVSAADVNAQCDQALIDYDGPTNAEMEARTPTPAQLAYIVANAATGVPVTFTTSGGTTTNAVLNQVDGAAASSTNDLYNGRLLVFDSGTLKGCVTDITDYDGSNGNATITAVPFAPAASHTARLI